MDNHHEDDENDNKDDENDDDDEGELIFLEGGEQVAYVSQTYNRESIMLSSRTPERQAFAEMLRRAGMEHQATTNAAQAPARRSCGEVALTGGAKSEKNDADKERKRDSTESVTAAERRTASDTPAFLAQPTASVSKWVPARGKCSSREQKPKLTRAISFARPRPDTILRQSAE